MRHSSLAARLALVAAVALPGSPLVLSQPAAGASASSSSTVVASAAPEGLTPSGGEGVNGIPVLDWAGDPAVSRYDVQVSTTDAFTSTLVNTTTVNSQYVPRVQLPSAPLWWRVRPTGLGDEAWVVADFRRSALAAPTPTGPRTSPALQQPQEAPVLSWVPVAGAISYEVEYGTDSNFTDPALKRTVSTKSTSYVVPLQIPGSYHWHVRGQLASGLFTDWSGASAYSVSGLGVPQVQRPNDSVNEVVQDVVLDWTAVPGAATYDLQVSTDVNFLTKVEDLTGITSTQYSRPATLDNDQYYWRVRPVDAAGNKPSWPSAPWRFRRAWPDQPHLEHPADQATVGDPFFLQWTPVRLASSYTVQISTERSFTPVSTVRSCTTVHTTFTPTDLKSCYPAAAGSYYWRVLAHDDHEQVGPLTDLISAEVFQFNYLPSGVDDLSMTAGEPGTVPTLRWSAAPLAAKYKVTITPVSGGSTITATTASTSYTPRKVLDDGSYRWDVQTISEDGRLGSATLPSSQPVFAVAALPAATASTPDPAPADAGTQHRFPTLSWTPVTGATKYELLVRRADAVGWTRITDDFGYPAGEDLTSAFLEPASYRWMVEAYSGTTLLSSSASTGTFTILAPEAVPPAQHWAALKGTAIPPGAASGQPGYDACSANLPNECQNLRQTPVLSWPADPTVGFYELTLSYDRELTNVLPGFPTTVNSTMWSPTRALPDSQAGSAYFWSVRSCSVAGRCALPRHADHAFNKQSRAVTLSSPADGAVVPDDVTLTWHDFLATQQDPWPTAGADPDTATPLDTPARTEARAYHVQTSTDASFQQNVRSTVVDQRSFTLASDTYAEGPVYWRVQAVDGSENPLAWSEVRTFSKESPRPTLTAPAVGGQVSSDQRFAWQPLSFAAQYQLEVYRDGDHNANPVNRVASLTTRRVVATVPSLPPATTPYTWRVRRIDTMGRPGQWSGLHAKGDAPRLHSFTVVGTAPTQLAPAPGAPVPPQESLFTWQGEQEAASYRFDRRLAGSPTVVESVTTPALAWAPPQAIAGGSWEWRVSAVGAEGQSLGSSPWRGFTVVDTVAATTDVVISGSGKVGSSLSLEAPAWNLDSVGTTYQWYRGTRAIEGATTEQYQLSPLDLDKSITVRATGARPGYKTGTSTSNVVVGGRGPAASPTQAPSITGAAVVGSSLTAQPGAWPAGTSFAYQWLLDGTPIARATGQSYAVKAIDAGRGLSVQVVGTAPGLEPGTATSGAVTVTKLDSTSAVDLADNKIPAAKRGRVTFEVSVTGISNPSGTVEIRDGAKVLARVALTPTSQGQGAVRLPRLKAGKHKITAVYLGSWAANPSQSAAAKLVVTR